MGADDNKAVVRRWNEEVWGARNLEVIEELIAEDAVIHDTAEPEPVRGPAGVRGSVERILTAFPDSSVELLHLVTEGHLVTAHFRATGTHEGEFQGVEPTGNRIDVTGMSIMRIREGKIAEEWQIVDAIGILRQIEAIPA